MLPGTKDVAALTPGPWKAKDVGRIFAIRCEDGHTIAFTNAGSMSRHACDNGIHGEAEQEANARLIAAAPDLLAALQECALLLEAVAPVHKETPAYAYGAEKAREAIAKCGIPDSNGK